MRKITILLVFIGIDDKVEIDLVILGSVAASKDGVRIGRGGGKNRSYFYIFFIIFP